MAKRKSSSRRKRGHESLQQVDESHVLDRVSFRLRAREPVLGWALAAYTAWVGVVVMPGVLMPWIGVLVAAMMASWARARPARKPGKVVIRYGLLSAMAFLLLSDQQVGGRLGPLLLWPAAIACAAVFMLRERWAAIVVGLALAAFIGASLTMLPRVPWLEVSTALVAMLVGTGLAYAFGSALRNTDAQLEAAMTDSKTKLYNETGFFTYGNELLAQCRARKKPLTMVLLNGADLHDIHELVGRMTSERLITQAVQGITAALPPGGLAAHMGKAEFAILVPETKETRAVELVRHKLGDPPGVRLQIAKKPIAVVFDMVSSEVPFDAQGLELVYERLYAQLGKMRKNVESPSTNFSDMSSYLPDPDRAISPTVPMELMRKA
jgi:GGDEF domain-containing protein